MSGGGTGGHIFPAIAIADEIKKRFPEAEFLFIGAAGKMEMEKVPQSGYKIEGRSRIHCPGKPIFSSRKKRKQFSRRIQIWENFSAARKHISSAIQSVKISLRI